MIVQQLNLRRITILIVKNVLHVWLLINLYASGYMQNVLWMLMQYLKKYLLLRPVRVAKYCNKSVCVCLSTLEMYRIAIFKIRPEPDSTG